MSSSSTVERNYLIYPMFKKEHLLTMVIHRVHTFFLINQKVKRSVFSLCPTLYFIQRFVKCSDHIISLDPCFVKVSIINYHS